LTILPFFLRDFPNKYCLSRPKPNHPFF
jgi:hypothetical protein